MQSRDTRPSGAHVAPGRFARDLRASVGVLISPRDTFRGFGDRDPLLAPWLLVSLLSVVLTFLTISVLQRASFHLLADTTSADLQLAAAASLQRMKIASTALAPLALFLQWAATAAALWAPAALAGSGAGYRRFLSIAAYAAAPQVLARATDLAVTWFEGPEFTNELVPALTASTSVVALFPDLEAGPWVEAALTHTTAFSLWGLALWVVGIRERGRLDWARSIAIATAAWFFFLTLTCASDVLNAAMTRSLSSTQEAERRLLLADARDHELLPHANHVRIRDSIRVDDGLRRRAVLGSDGRHGFALLDLVRLTVDERASFE
jgi:hypothetical protein